jgi:hypothetical protein
MPADPSEPGTAGHSPAPPVPEPGGAHPPLVRVRALPEAVAWARPPPRLRRRLVPERLVPERHLLAGGRPHPPEPHPRRSRRRRPGVRQAVLPRPRPRGRRPLAGESGRRRRPPPAARRRPRDRLHRRHRRHRRPRHTGTAPRVRRHRRAGVDGGGGQHVAPPARAWTPRTAARPTAPGSRLQLWDCHGGPNRRWVASAARGLVSPAADKCAEATDGSTANGTRWQIGTCTNAAHRKPPTGSGRCPDAVHGVSRGFTA